MAERNQSLSLTLISPEDLAGQGSQTVFDGADTSAWLRLEQDEQFLELEANSPCIQGRLIVGIQVYRSDEALEYQLEASYGTLGDEPEVIEEEITETFFFNLESELDLTDEGATAVLSASWEGSVRDEAGNVVLSPPLFGKTMKFENGLLSWGIKLHGSLLVTYRKSYEHWRLTLLPRGGMGQYDPAAYASTVSAFFGGQADNLEIDTEFDCGGGGGGDDDDDDDPTGEQCYWHVIEVDPCTAEPTGKTWEELADCPAEEPAA